MVKEIKIEVTEECKRWCVHCSSQAKDVHFQYLDETLVKRLIHEAALMKAESVVFTGGEATLYPEIEAMIQEAHRLGLTTKLYTMCDPNEESIDKIKNLVVYGLDEMIYSTTYHLTRDGMITLDKLQEFFPNLLSVTPIRLGFHHAITTETIYDIDDVIELFFSLPEEKRTKLSFLRFVPHGRGTKALLPNREQLLWFKQKMIEYKEKYGSQIRLGSPWNFLGIENTSCNAAEESMIIGFDGNVYPCDAMKYFDYLGLGGNVKEIPLKQIYDSKYFKSIRDFKQCVSGECLCCSNYSICRGGCLGQKMVDFMDDSHMTFAHYGELAKRTMNQFDNEEIKKMNGEMGVVGEIGELVDSFKKYKTHNLTSNSKERLLKNLEIEIGDIVWYLAASLSSAYGFEFEDIGNYIANSTGGNTKMTPVNDVSLLQTIKRKDPDCFYRGNEASLSIAFLDDIALDDYQFESEWKKLVQYAYQILFATEKMQVLINSAGLLMSLTRIAHFELEISMEQILRENLEKLKKRYEKGFDSEIASSRIALLTDYKESEPDIKKPYQKK